MLEGVRRTGAATWSDDFLSFFERDLPREEVHVRFTYGPILAADGRTVEGVFCPCTEITDEVVGARRLETLRQLGVKSPESRSVRAACAEAARVLSGDPHDIPFAAIYVADEAGDGASLVASAGLPEDHPLPPWASLAAGDDTPWPLAAVLRTGRAEEVRDLRRLAGPLPGSPWPEPPSRAVVLPVPAPNHGGLAGLLALGVSPRRVWTPPIGPSSTSWPVISARRWPTRGRTRRSGGGPRRWRRSTARRRRSSRTSATSSARR